MVAFNRTNWFTGDKNLWSLDFVPWTENRLFIPAYESVSATHLHRHTPRSGPHHRAHFIQFGDFSLERTKPTVAMSTEVRMEPVAEIQYDGVGRCKCSFWFAVAHDILGLVIMMTGVFGGLAIHDLLIYAGSIIIFFSLIWWVFWYSGNIDVPPGELEDDVGMMKPKNRGLTGVVRHMSSRVSSGLRNSFRRSSGRFRRDEAPGAGDVPQHRDSRPSTGSQMRNVEVALSTISEVTESTAS